MRKIDGTGAAQPRIPASVRRSLLADTSLLALVIGASAALSPPALAQSVPAGGAVTSGQASIATSPSGVLINQSSQNAIISWQSFSIGGGATAHFENGSGATLNRVTGNLPSSIDGSLTATGSVYLINPAGVAIGTSGMVRTGGSFVASTHDVSDSDFLDGGDLTLKGDSKASVVNQGSIAAQTGDVVLTARRVENSGTIDTPSGSVGLLGGYEVLLRDTSLADGKFAVKVGGADTEVVNSGIIRAAEVELRANGGSVQALAGNTKGIIKATGVKKSGGRIFLTAGEGGSVTVTQRVVARRAATQQTRAAVAALPDSVPLPEARPDFSGGEVHITGGSVSLGGAIDAAGGGAAGGAIIAVAKDKLDVTATASLDASGTDGGLILLGGDYQGGKDAATNYWTAPVGTTAQTDVAAEATIRANGTTGAGGKVVVWADDEASFAGTISATGVSQGGDAEVSGKALLAYTGTADLRADSGLFGTLLLDPYNITISAAGDFNQSGFTATGDDSFINIGTLQNALALANVTVSTGASGTQAGNITVAAALSWASSATLTLQAAGSIALNADITASLGGLTLNAGSSIGATGALSLGRFTLAAGNWVQNNASLPGFEAADFRIAGGTFLRATGGTGSGGNPYTLVDVYGLQGIGSSVATLSVSYKLASDIDASGTANWNAGAGFRPIGTDVTGNVIGGFGGGFVGNFDGAGHTISGLTINRPTAGRAGLFGNLGLTGSVSNVGLLGGSITGNSPAGSLVGWNQGTITQSWSTASVSSSGSWVGGLVGINQGAISRSYANGAISGGTYVGGLVGENEGTISQSYATGAVSGTSDVGGLVGWNNNGGTISQTWASGAVSGSSNLGGLVGSPLSSGTVSASYWDMDTSGQATSVGGTGLTTAQARNAASYVGFDFASDWYQAGGMRPIGRWEAATPVGGVITISNLHELQLVNINLAGSYVLAGDIDASATQRTSGIWGAGGFVPIGTDGAGFVLNGGSGFTGSFDGLGHTIAGLAINRPSAIYVGLFGSTGGAIANVGIVGGSVTGSGWVGSLVGYNAGIITQTYSTGGVSSPGGSYVGGLVGSNNGTGTITRSYATGSVTGLQFVGGLAGFNNGTITQTYAAGAVSGATDVGGLVGYDGGGTVNASYWDMDTSGQATSGGGTGLTTAQMQDLSSFHTTYAGWDFTNVWAPPNQVGQNNGSATAYYPELYALSNVMSVQAADATRIYGDADPAFSAQYYGMQAGAYVAAPGILGTAATQASGVGSYAIIASGAAVGGANAAAYRIVYTGNLTVTPRAITVTADVKSKIYGETNPPLTYTVGGLGLVNGDTLSGALDTTATAASSVGTYAIDQGTLDNANYAITYAGADLTIGQRSITVTADAKSRLYGDTNPALTYTVGDLGLVNGDALSGSLDTTATAASSVGTYAIDQGTLDNANYAITYAGADLTIGQRSITVTADAKSRLYGDTNPALTYTVGGLGLVNGDALSGTLVTSATTTASVGTYGIGQGDLAASANYAVTYQGADLTVNQRSIALSANDLARIYGDADPLLTFGAVGGDGLASFDASPAHAGFGLTTTATTISDVGSYAIALTGANANYAVTFTPGMLTVNQRAITVTADSQSRPQSAPDPALTWSLTGGSLASFDSDGNVFAGALIRAPGEAVGDYAIGQGTLTANANYAMSFVGGVLSITPVQITDSRPFEPPADDKTLQLVLDDAGDAIPASCKSGVLGGGCTPYVHTDNRGLGPFVDFRP